MSETQTTDAPVTFTDGCPESAVREIALPAWLVRSAKVEKVEDGRGRVIALSDGSWLELDEQDFTFLIGPDLLAALFSSADDAGVVPDQDAFRRMLHTIAAGWEMWAPRRR